MYLRMEPVTEATLSDWQQVHNLVIPYEQYSVEAIRERLGINRLGNVYLGDVLIGNYTVRPPVNGTATVIVRMLPDFRRKGYGQQVYKCALQEAYELGAGGIETIVLAVNVDGLLFAQRQGFVEMERYIYPDDGTGGEYVVLHLEHQTT